MWISLLQKNKMSLLSYRGDMSMELSYVESGYLFFTSPQVVVSSSGRGETGKA